MLGAVGNQENSMRLGEEEMYSLPFAEENRMLDAVESIVTAEEKFCSNFGRFL